MIGVSYPTALKMKRCGEVQTVKVGGIFRVYAEELRRFQTEGNALPELPEEEAKPLPLHLPSRARNTRNKDNG